MAQMEQPKFESEIANIFFLARLGTTFRCLSSDIVREEIPAEWSGCCGSLSAP